MRRAPDVKDGVVAASATTEQGWYCAHPPARMAQTLPHAGRTLNRPLARDLPRDRVNGTLAKARAGGCASAVVPGRAALRRRLDVVRTRFRAAKLHTRDDGMFVPVRLDFWSMLAEGVFPHERKRLDGAPRASHLEGAISKDTLGCTSPWRHPTDQDRIRR